MMSPENTSFENVIWNKLIMVGAEKRMSKNVISKRGSDKPIVN